MTIPYERFRAVDNTREWLFLNLSNQRLPKYLRDEISSLLRHYPSRMELAAIAADSPAWLEAEPDAFVEWVNERGSGVDTESE